MRGRLNLPPGQFVISKFLNISVINEFLNRIIVSIRKQRRYNVSNVKF